MRILLPALLTALLLSLGCARPAADGQTPAGTDEFQRKGTKEQRADKDKLEGKTPPALKVFDWTNTGGKELALADLKGKVVLLYFWGFWSPECKAATPRLKKLAAQHRAGLVLV